MCTQKLWKRVGGGSKLRRFEDMPSSGAGKLGNWSGTLVTLRRRPFALFANQTTLACVVVRLAPAKSLFERLPAVVEAELNRLGVAADTAHEEGQLLVGAPASTNADRSLLGSLNDLAYQLTVATEYERWIGEEPDYVALHERLNTTPHVKRDLFADQAVRKLFGVSEPAREEHLPELTRRRVERVLEAFCERIPHRVRHQLRNTYRIEGNTVTVVEQRVAYNDPHTWIDIPFAQFERTPSTGYWRLYCADRDGVWHLYTRTPATPNLDELIAEVKRDPTGIFLG